MSMTPGVASPPAAPSDPRQALVSVSSELRSAMQQAHAAGLTVPFEPELEALRLPTGVPHLVLWARGDSAEFIQRVASLLGLQTSGASSIAAGDRSQVRDELRDAFEWQALRGTDNLTCFLTRGPLAPELEAWLAYEADALICENDAPRATAAGLVRRLEPEGFDTVLAAVLSIHRDELRQVLFLRSRLWRSAVFVDALDQIVAEHLRRARSRRLRDDIRARQLEREALIDPARQSIDTARQDIDERIAVIQRTIAETGKVAFGPDGTVVVSVRAAIDSMGASNLIESEGAETDRLKLDDRSFAHIVDVLKQHLRTALRDDWRAFESSRGGFPAEVDAGTEKSWLQGYPPVALENAYLGEIPRGGFFRHLSRGKQAVFATMSVLTLVGMLFRTNWRMQYWVVLMLLPLFVFYTIWSARRFNAEREEKRGKELEKMLDALIRDVRRVVMEFQRERQTRVQSLLDGIRREAMRQLESQGRGLAQRRGEELQRARSEIRDRTRSTDARLRDATTLSTCVGRARQAASHGLSEADRTIRVALTGRKVPA
jgi:hypothetical protein